MLLASLPLRRWNISITEANGLSGLNLSAANGSVTLTVTTGSVSDLDNATDITAKSTTVTVSNGSFGTNANAIASVDELTVSTAAQNGDIYVTEANGLSNLSLSAGQGSVTLSVTTGSVSDLDNATDISAKSANVTVSNGSFGTSANAIVTSVDELTSAPQHRMATSSSPKPMVCRTCRYRPVRAMSP